ncbi:MULTISPECIES: alpha/beta hydrolase family protein [Streptomyces]|uniref:alpha/beta hydrolase family protein n=1 Tax=Streptomyces TaxID=1883 RepID=UPI001E5BA850|nr:MULTISPECIES: acetylxylan esterase [Streptomyces]UFQ19071.1 acetylxylan esterase [Streptomyces huasconensis]WCL88690.1 acetylxylan esterase [Streptomyces sp. JCM 35825]
MTDDIDLGRTEELALDDDRTAILRLPDEPLPGRTVPAVVLLHPFGAWDRDAFLPAEASGNGPVRLFGDLGAALVRAGTGAATFDTRFLTEDRRAGAGSPRFTFTGLVDDAVRAAEQVRAHPDVDDSRVLLLGVSMGVEVALAAAERLGGDSRLVLVAPSAQARPVFQRWMGLDRRLEWLTAAGFAGADGTVDLAAAQADDTGRSGWWEEFDLVDRFGRSADLEVLRAELAREYDDWEQQALAHGDESAPASFWRDWYLQPAPYRRLAGITGRMMIHVGAEDWTTPPRQAHLLHHAALTRGLRSQLTVHPRLGHLMSPRSADGRRTYGPFAPAFLESLVASVEAVLRPDPTL